MLRARRQQEILNRLHQEQSVMVNKLALDFNVAESTIRRDLNELESKNLIKRDYGGAVTVGNYIPEPPFRDRQVLRKREKEFVGRLSAEQINDNETIFIDGGTTTEFIIPHIQDRKNLTVVTCGFNIAARLVDCPGITTILVGGLIDPVSKAIVPLHSGDIAQLQHIRVNKSFISAVGVSAEFGITNSLLDRIPTKQQALQIAANSYLVVDGSKIGEVAVGFVAPINMISAVITDNTAPENELALLRTAGVTLIIAEIPTFHDNADRG